MATREERMASRLRGAGRRIEEDISFGFDLPQAEPSILAEPPPPAPDVSTTEPSAQPPLSATTPSAPTVPQAPRSANPNTSAKRRRISPREPNRQAIPARSPVAPLAPPPLPLSATRSGRGRPDPYDALNNVSPQSTRSRATPHSTRSGAATDALRRSLAAQTQGQVVDEDEMESLPARPTPRTGQRGFTVTTRTEEIVQESPADAPGSGQRRRVVRVSQVAGGAGAMLQRVMQGHAEERRSMSIEQRRQADGDRDGEEEEEEEDEITADMDVDLGVDSSPLVRRSTKTAEKQARTPTDGDEEDEITAEVDLSSGLPAASSPLARKATKRSSRKGKTASEKGQKPTPKARNMADKETGQTGEKSASRRTARRSGAGTASFGLEEVDELSPAQAPAPPSSVRVTRTGRLSGVSADDGVDELSPAAAKTRRRSVKRPASAMADDGEVDELSHVPAKKQRGKPARKAAVEESAGTPPLSAPQRKAGRPPKKTTDEAEVPVPASASKSKRGAGRPRKNATEQVESPAVTPAAKTKERAQLVADVDADELDEPSLAPVRTARRSVRLSDVSAELAEVDELSPERTREVMGPSPKPKPRKDTSSTKLTEVGAGSGTKSPAGRPRRTPTKTPTRAAKLPKPTFKLAQVQSAEELVEQEEPEQAEEIDVTEAARRLGRKRPRRSIAGPEEPEQQDEDSEPAVKRRRGRPPQSPATQQPPKTRKEKKSAASSSSQQPKKPPAERKPKAAAPSGDDDDELHAAPDTVSITVQRFTKRVPNPVSSSSTSDEPDPLSSITTLIPFSSRAGVSSIDVLSQICAELLTSTQSTLRSQGRDAADAAARREIKTKIRTLELFGEELQTRLLGHAIALDTLHALRKRVRAARRERVGLREEILRIKREREDVEVRKDAVRTRHEREREEAMANINLSSAMHDIDLAIEKGRAAEEEEPLDAKEESRANLANLEFLVDQVAEQACSRAGQGGRLKQIREFNAFLERAAAALEGR